ncbi:MAG TPA: hypothetical protein VFU31_00520 [Candidatus Binatia bacterium]|nr:hypothetical protein [Candidatus Binatia bacterium]
MSDRMPRAGKCPHTLPYEECDECRTPSELAEPAGSAVKYNPAQCLREEVNRFKATNRFTPMLVTGFYIQAAVVLNEHEEMRRALQVIACDAAAVRDEWLATQPDGIRSIIANIRRQSAGALRMVSPLVSLPTMSEQTTQWQRLLTDTLKPKSAERIVSSAWVGCAGSGKPSVISELCGRVMCPVCTKYVHVEAGQKTPRHKESSGHRKFRY